MAGSSERQATYLSQRSADVVLSDIRPTKLTPEGLRSINVLLDELLWMILSTARSFSTDQLKAALLRVLPTPLGKSALLEAEVELRAYWERTSAPSQGYVENQQDFPLQPAYELLRIKCEAYSTLSDLDEDSECETRWQTKVVNTTGFSKSNTQYIASAALYLTAIIEFICEHVLSNTGRVAARDSSRTSATLNDFYVALCEDDAIYGLFKSMQVYTHIEQQSRAAKGPRRSKSIRRSTSEHARAPSRDTASQLSGMSNDVAQPAAKARLSSESAGSGTANAAVPSTGSRSSIEKARVKKFFGRSSAEKEASSNGHADGHKRTESLISNGKRSTTPFDDGPGSSPSATEVEFDELMRSGATMKVSLTPDRLRTFESFKDKTHRGGMRQTPPASISHHPNGKPSTHEVSGSGGLEHFTPAVLKDSNSTAAALPSQPLARPVEAIAEDEENGVVGSFESERNSARQRKKSRGPPPVSYESSPMHGAARTRSMSASQSAPSAVNGHHSIGRKASLNALATMTSQTMTKNDVFSRGPPPQIQTLPISRPSNGVSRHKSSSSFDENLYDSSDEDEDVPRRGAHKGGKHVRVGGVSQATRDLISFLNDGPPDLPVASPPMIAPGPQMDLKQQKKGGRFRSMVSKLTKGSSEKLVSQPSSDDLSSPSKRSALPYVPPPLSAKKSLASISSYARNQIMPANNSERPPVPPLPIQTQIAPQYALAEPAPGSPARSRYSPTRKAVPTWLYGEEESTPVAEQLSQPVLVPQPPLVQLRQVSQPTKVQPPSVQPIKVQPTPVQPTPVQLVPPPTPSKDDLFVPVAPVPPASPVKAVVSEKRHGMLESISIPRASTPESISRGSVTAAVPSTPRSITSVHDTLPVVPKRTSSINATPPPLRASTPSSKSERKSLTASVSPIVKPTSTKVIDQVTEMRKLMANASNADECRLLVDMFLAQSGIPLKATDFPRDASLEPTEEQEAAVIETLLSDSFVIPEAPREEIKETPTSKEEKQLNGHALEPSSSSSEVSPTTPSTPVPPAYYHPVQIPSTYQSPYRKQISTDIDGPFGQVVSAGA